MMDAKRFHFAEVGSAFLPEKNTIRGSARIARGCALWMYRLRSSRAVAYSNTGWKLFLRQGEVYHVECALPIVVSGTMATWPLMLTLPVAGATASGAAWPILSSAITAFAKTTA